MRIHQTVDERDTTELEVNYADGGAFWLALLWPDKTGEEDDHYWMSVNITAGASANEVYQAVRGFYRSGRVSGVDPVVTLSKCRGHDDLEIADCEAELGTGNIRDYVYTIEVPRSISRATCSDGMPIPVYTSSDVQLRLP